MARPSEYDLELCKEICKEVSQGKGIKWVCDNNDQYPAFVTFCRWVDKYEELRHIYYASLKDKAQAKEHKYEQYLNDLETGKIDAHTGKVLLDATRWQMATLNSKIYGQKSGLVQDGEEVSGISIVIHKKED